MSKHLSNVTPQLLKRISNISWWFVNEIFKDDEFCLTSTRCFSTRYHSIPSDITYFPYTEKYDFYSTLIKRDLLDNNLISDDIIAQFIVFNSYLIENDFEYKFNDRNNIMLPYGIEFSDIIKHFSIDMLYLLSLLIYEISSGGEYLSGSVFKKIFALLRKIDLTDPLMFPKLYVANHDEFIELCMVSTKAGYHSPLTSFFESSFVNKANTIDFKLFDKLLTSFNKSISEKTSFDLNMH